MNKNIGWLTEEDQDKINKSTIAIGGCGGVGGRVAEMAARLGYGNIIIADGDVFDQSNKNRQLGAYDSTLNKSKVEVICDIIKDINPNINVIKKSFILKENVYDFLEGSDFYIDGIDIGSNVIRREIFKACLSKDIPSVTSFPIGLTATGFFFGKGYSVDNHYNWKEGDDNTELLFKMLAKHSDVDMQSLPVRDWSKFDLENGSGSSTVLGINMASYINVLVATKYFMGIRQFSCIIKPLDLVYLV